MSTMTAHLLRAPLAREAGLHLTAYTQPELGPSLRVAHLGALHGHLIAAGALPRRGTLQEPGYSASGTWDPPYDARHFRVHLSDDEHPEVIATRWTLLGHHAHDLTDTGDVYLPDLAEQPVYLAGVLYGYAQATSEWPDAIACDGCGRRITDADEDQDGCPYGHATFCHVDEHRKNCGNPADCFDDPDLTNDLRSDR